MPIFRGNYYRVGSEDHTAIFTRRPQPVFTPDELYDQRVIQQRARSAEVTAQRVEAAAKLAAMQADLRGRAEREAAEQREREAALARQEAERQAREAAAAAAEKARQEAIVAAALERQRRIEAVQKTVTFAEKKRIAAIAIMSMQGVGGERDNAHASIERIAARHGLSALDFIMALRDS